MKTEKYIPLGAAHEALRRILKNHARGPRAAIPNPTLVGLLRQRNITRAITRLRWEDDLDDLAINDRTLPCLIRDLRVGTPDPVTSGGKGYYWARTVDEMKRGRHYVASRFNDLRIIVDSDDRKIALMERAQRAARRHEAMPATELMPAGARDEHQEALFDTAGQAAGKAGGRRGRRGAANGKM